MLQGMPPIFPPDPLPPILLGGSVNILAGASGTGKTALLASWLKALKEGKPFFPGYAPPPGAIKSISVISADRSWAQSGKKWFDLVDWGNINCYSIQDDFGFKIERLRRKSERTAILGECMNALGYPEGRANHAVICVDPLGLFLGGNLIDYDTCLVACSEIRRLCISRSVTIIGLAHASKQLADPKRRYLRMQDRLAGSTALYGYSDTQMYLAAPEEISAAHYGFYWNPHHSPAETFTLRRRDDGLFHPPERLIEAEPPLPRIPEPPRAELLRWITVEGVLFGNLYDFAQQHPTLDAPSERTLRRWLTTLIDEGAIAKTGHGKYKRVRPN